MRVLTIIFLAFSPAASAGEAEDVRLFFDRFVERTNAYDVGVADLYSPGARIITLRDGKTRMEMPGAHWKELLVQTMPIAKRRGDTNTFENVKVSSRDQGFRVTATRHSAVKCVPDTGYYLDVARVGDDWRVMEEYAETVSLSQCEPSEELAASLESMRAQILPHLPLDLDADTKLVAVEVLGPNLIYHQRLHTIAASEMDLEKLVPMLRQLAVQNACGVPEMKTLIDQGATVRYAYVDRNDTSLAKVDIVPGLCG